MCLARVSVWCVSTRSSDTPPNSISFSLSHQQRQSSLVSLYFLAYVSYLYSREGSCDACGIHQVIKDISASYDALVDLFVSFESFLRRLDIYTKIPSTTAMTEIIIKILIELMSSISLAIQQAKQGRLSERHPLLSDFK